MIQFKITACPDKSQMTSYGHDQKEMSIGSETGDMVIDDPGISPRQVHINCGPNGAVIVNLAPKVSVRINGSPLTGQPMPLKANDNLQMGSTTIFFTLVNDKIPAAPAAWVNETSLKRLQKVDTVEYAIYQGFDILIASKGGVKDEKPPLTGQPGAAIPPALPNAGSGPPPIPGTSGKPAIPTILPRIPGKK